MDLDLEFGTDLIKELEGVWFTMPHGDASMLLAAIDNSKYRDLRAKLMMKNPYKSLGRMRSSLSTVQADLMDRLMITLLSKSIVLDWRGINDKDGKAVPFSEETITEYLTRLPRLREWVLECAGELEAYQTEDREEAEKNLLRSSSGSSVEASIQDG